MNTFAVLEEAPSWIPPDASIAVALALSLALRRWDEAVAIAAVLVINAAIGYFTQR